MRDALRPELRRRLLHEGLSAGVVESLLTYHADLLRFNRSQNLVSRRGGEAIVDRLVLECALAAGRLGVPEGRPLLDIGSGAGLPGLPVALVRPENPMDLLERRGGRCEFLRRELRSLGLDRARVLEGDAAVLAGDPAHTGRYARVLLKALAPPADALALGRPFLAPEGRAVLFQGLDWPDREIATLEGWSLVDRQLLDLEGFAPSSTAIYLLAPL